MWKRRFFHRIPHAYGKPSFKTELIKGDGSSLLIAAIYGTKAVL